MSVKKGRIAYKVGTRVKHEKYGKGTVKGRGLSDDTICVEFDIVNRDVFHTCNRKCQAFRGYWCDVVDLAQIVVEWGGNNNDKV